MLNGERLSLPEARVNVLSGLTVALALVPEAIAFALVAHVNPLVGLYAAFFLCFLTATLGGRPGMISGATGATAVVMAGLVAQHGVQYLLAAIVCMGVLQIVFAVLRLGKLIRMVPHPVMLGFVNGLAIVIFRAQLAQFKVPGTGRWIHGAALATMCGLVAATMLIIYLFPKLTRAVPASLAAIVIVAAFSILTGLHTRTVGDMASICGGFPTFHLPAVPWNLDTLRIVLPYSVTLASVGLIETLLTLNLVDDLTETRGNANRECFAQGTANIVSGLFGAMGGCAMIGQTMINVNAGARRRLSGVMAALFLLSFILFGSSWIERVPIAALVGVMFVVCERTFEWGSFRVFGKVPRQDAFIVVAVTLVTVFTNLATAVILGILIAALGFAWNHSRQISAVARSEGSCKVYEISGTLFFASVSHFFTLFTPRDDPDEVVLELRSARIADHSALEALGSLSEKYARVGKRLHLRHLNPDCRILLEEARPLVAVGVLDSQSGDWPAACPARALAEAEREFSSHAG